MIRRYFGKLIFVISALVAAISMAAAAQASSTPAHAHKHGADRGTVEAPLSIVRDPADLAAAPSAKMAARVVVELETVEVTGMLSNGTAYHYWTFGGKVPGPFSCRYWPGRRRNSHTDSTRREAEFHV